jgi:hypothetical protein
MQFSINNKGVPHPVINVSDYFDTKSPYRINTEHMYKLIRESEADITPGTTPLADGCFLVVYDGPARDAQPKISSTITIKTVADDTVTITDEEGNEKEAAKYEIDVPDANGGNYLWKNYVEAVNDKILDLTESEDKQLGEFFIKPDNGNIISKERFLGKVMFYLWSEVCKDEHKNGSFFRTKINDKEDFFTFQDLYKKKDLLKLFMDGLLAPKN